MRSSYKNLTMLAHNVENGEEPIIDCHECNLPFIIMSSVVAVQIKLTFALSKRLQPLIYTSLKGFDFFIKIYRLRLLFPVLNQL